MKRNYIKPETIAISLQTEGMVAVSTGEIPVNPDPGTPATNEKEADYWGDTAWDE